MTDQKTNLLDFGKIVSKIVLGEIKREKKEDSSQSVYIVEEYDTKSFLPCWKKKQEFVENMFAAIEYAKELSEERPNNQYKVTQQKGGISETVWHS